MYCLRCGREIPESQSFCDACKETVSQPLEESPYLNTQIRLPVRKPRTAKAPAKAGKRPERKGEKPAASRGQGALIGFLSCFSLLLVAAGLLFALFYLQREKAYEEQTVALAQLEEEQEALTHRVGELNVEYVLINPATDRIYHRLDCPEAQLQGFRLIRLESAVLQGYEPCSYCE